MTKLGLEPNFENMGAVNFGSFFQGEARDFLLWNIRLSLAEDGEDLTSRAVFAPEHRSEAVIVAKQDSLVVGLPIIPMTLAEAEAYEAGEWTWKPLALEGSPVKNGDQVARIEGNTRLLFKAERVLLNYIMQLSGVANLTALYVRELEGTGSRLLDTRKTYPGLRYPQKYAVRMGGGLNHRLGLDKMLLLKDNHIDAAGSVSRAVEMARRGGPEGLGLEVECRSLDEVQEAVALKVDRLMLDNMDSQTLSRAMELIPPGIETEVSGGVGLESLSSLAGLKPRGPDFISVGRLTHSAPAADFSLCFVK